MDQGHDRIAVFGEHIVQCNPNFSAPGQITGFGQFGVKRVIGWIAKAVDILTLPL